MKNRLIFIFSTFILSPIFGESSTNAGMGEAVYQLSVFDYLLFGAAALTILFTVYILMTIFKLWINLQEQKIYEEKGLEYNPVKPVHKTESIVSKLYEKLTATVPLENEKEILLNHNYDGIQELDNNLPPWWLYGFYLSIFIAIVYFGYFQLSGRAPTTHEIYYQEVAAAKVKAFEYMSRQANLVNEKNVEALVDAEDIAAGQKVFKTNCIACHLESGGGSATSVGPNLTDEYWLHGGGIKNIFKTVKYGVPEKGMIAWKTQLPASDIHKVASYVLTLQGTNPPAAKAPQGDKWDPSQAEE